ncbi:hypothetical protein TNCT_653111 [Trichonephila clavata]|uniref:Uncharacterized protein n=1 Tax=Trichonephila clavata TaxID=2740835 RepID=A0A8X6LJ00_TRICU|nr:hypothetical protein TNCT_653111 [Trichonephila clavata]
MSDTDSYMDSQSVCSDTSTKSDAYKAYASRILKPMTDCKKRADIVLRIKQLDTLIAGYSRLLTLPECPGNTVLMQMTRKEKIDGIAKKGTFGK